MKTVVKYIEAIKNNVEYRIGGNAQENFDLIDDSQPNDLWFHVQQDASCHVVAKMSEEDVYDKKQRHKIAVQGAILCKQFSKRKSDRSVPIMVAPIHCVAKTKKTGCVTVETYSTVVI